MIIQHTFIQEGCWLDPLRSIVKAADTLRRECNRIMVAFYEENLETTVQFILRTLRSGYRIDRRAAYPSTAQLLLDGLDWQLELLLTSSENAPAEKSRTSPYSLFWALSSAIQISDG